MSQDKRGLFAQIFIGMMIFTVLVWVWTVAFIISWPWKKSDEWKPDFRVVAICANDEFCSVPFGQLEEARSTGKFKTLSVPDAGDAMEENNWIKWTTSNGVIEAKASSWHFQTTIRYKLEGDKPVLLEYQDVEAKALYYGIAAALFSLTGLYLRKLRKR